MHSTITSAPIDVAALLARVADPANGAAVLFIGTVREQNEGRPVTGIDYAAYETMASGELERIVRECGDRFGTPHIAAEHRIGRLDVGEVSVAIAAAHPHRAQAYEASRWVIEEIKRRLPVWKREEYVDGTREWLASRESGIGDQESTRRSDLVDATNARESRFPIPDSR